MSPITSEYMMANNSNQLTTAMSSNVTDDPEDYNHWSFEFSVIMAIILSISAFVTIVGNSMVLMVIIRHRGMRTRTNLFLVNLAIADLLIGLLVLPFSITTLIEGRWVFGYGAMCSLNSWMNAFCLTTSIHTLMYIGIHKFFSIVKPLNNPLKLKHIICMMAAAWIWGALCASIVIFGLKVVYKPGTSQCGPNYPTSWQDYIYHGIIQITVIFIPYIILVYCYIRMFREIKRHSERLRNNSTVEEDFLITQQKKVAVTLFIVLSTFAVMIIPYHLYATYTTITKDKEHFPGFINPLAYLFCYLNSMVNPIIYAFRSPAFREGYKEILCQTPNYVISDESDHDATPRRQSIFPFRRTSRPSVSNTTLLLDNESNLLPTTSACSNKKKSLVDLVRSTRQSNASSVIHHNGDMIIIKGGKIISVRRLSEVSCPPRANATPLLDMTRAVIDESANTVICGIALNAAKSGDADNDENSNSTGTGFGRPATLTSVTEMSFEQMDADLAGLDDPNVFEDVEDEYLCMKKDDLCLKNVTIPKCEDNNSEAETEVDRTNISQSQRRGKTPDIEIIYETDEGSQPLLEPKPAPSSTALSKMVMSIASNTNMLVGMPLTPQTGNSLAKSDMNLNHSSSPPVKLRHKNNVAIARSTENLNPCKKKYNRMPSMEYLGPPVRLLRTRSSTGLKYSH